MPRGLTKEFILVFEDLLVSKKFLAIKAKHLILFQGQQYSNRLVVVNSPPGFSNAFESIMISDKINGSTGYTTLFTVPIDSKRSIPFKFIRIDDRHRKPLDCKIVLDSKNGEEKIIILPRFPKHDSLSDEDREDILSYLRHTSDDVRVRRFLENPDVYRGEGRKKDDS
ncbi:hypothetical protein AAEO50_00390 [Rossellomorea oryzaecorticis]|uniref:Uncharacterized protein n=1 Tax=Rossellomorea oryzaecorticis TaxID=1396505 RepID=A0ABU9K3Q9_9BACI